MTEKGVRMGGFNHFIPLTKVVEQDDGSCLVYTRGVQEEPDYSNEIFDYETSVPFLEKWSDGAYRRSRGQSYGNIRAMHGKNAVGKVIEPLRYNPNEKAVDLVIKVVDPVEVKKCREGVYTGMSIGGRYAKRWPDPKLPGTTRYTADPIEFSLVDLPNVRSATFDLVKVGGDTEIRKFAEDSDGSEPVNDIVADMPSSDSPDPDKVDKPEVPEWKYQVKEGVDTPGKAPNALAHGVEEAKVIPQPEPKGAPALSGDFEKVMESFKSFVEARRKEEELEKVAGEQLNELGKRAGIARREGSPLKPPVGYPEDSVYYGDPANWAWRYDTGEFARAAVVDYNLQKNRDRYSDREWNVLGRRIAYRAGALGYQKVTYDPVNKRIVAPEKNMDLKKGGYDEVLGQLRQIAQSAAADASPEACINALHQILAGLDVMADPSNMADPAPDAKPLQMAAGATSTPKMPPPSSAKPEGEETKEESTPKVEKADEETGEMDELKKQIALLTNAVNTLLKPKETVRPGLLTKNAPLGDLNGLPQSDEGPEMTPLRKSILAAASQVAEGVTPGAVQDVMKQVGGDGEKARSEAMRMVQQSLVQRGFTSQSKIRVISPAIRAQIQQSLANN